ncbi:MAG: Hpt domain-containing protein [Thermodesulfobacteriota bacterium]|nr:Hpt domain-containing protein [Thermodesulfobacteriota bacterium]
MDLKKMASNLGIGDDDFLELTELLVNVSLTDLSKIQAGLEADNADQVATAAHSIKGAAGNLGFIKLSEIALYVEKSARAGSLKGLEDKQEGIKLELDTISSTIG